MSRYLRGSLNQDGTTIVLARGATEQTTLSRNASVAAAITVTLPVSTDTLVGRATTDTLTNKTLTSPKITDAGAGDLILTSSSSASADRTLTLNVNNADRTVSLSGNLTLAGTLTTAAALTTAGAFALTLTTTAETNVTLPTTGTLSTIAGIETLTSKTLTSPDINGGTADSLTSLSLRDTSAAYDVTVVATSSPALGAGRTLTLNMQNAARTISLGGNLTVEAASTVNQDLTSDASPTFAGATLTAFAGVVKATAGVLSAATVVNADVASNAAIDYSKLGILTADRALISNGTGAVSPSLVTSTTLSYLDATSSIQTQINGKQASDADLTALAALASTGIAARTAANTWAQRTITGTANRLGVTDGDGVAGNPTLNVDTSLLPSPGAGDANKVLIASGANAAAWAEVANAHIAAAAAIDRSKIASGTNDHVVINGAAGALSSEAQLAITRGGTGQATANTALNALLPAQATHSGKVLSTDGTDTSWAAALTSTLNDEHVFIGNAANAATAVSTALLGDVSATYDTATVTFDYTGGAAEDIVEYVAHPFSNWDKIYFTNSGGALPAELTVSTAYYVRDASTDYFKVAATVGGAAVAFTDDGAGTSTVHSGGLVLANPTVAARATGTTAPASVAESTHTYIKFDTESYDTHGALSHATTGTTPLTSGTLFTAPIAGIYAVSAGILFGSANAWGATVSADYAQISIRTGVAGTTTYSARTVESHAAAAHQLNPSISDEVQLDAGETIQISVYYKDSGGADQQNLINGTMNYLSIKRLGGVL